MENLTLKAAIILSGERRGTKRAAALRLFAGLMRQGVEIPAEAVEFIAKSLEDHAAAMPKSTPQGGRPRSASNFLGYVAHVLMQELSLSESDAVKLLLDYMTAHGKSEIDDSTIRKMRGRYKGMLVCEPESLESVRRILTWAKTREVSA